MAQSLPEEPGQLLALGWQLPRDWGSLTSAAPSSQAPHTLQSDPRHIPKGSPSRAQESSEPWCCDLSELISAHSDFYRSHLTQKGAGFYFFTILNETREGSAEDAVQEMEVLKMQLDWREPAARISLTPCLCLGSLHSLTHL